MSAEAPSLPLQSTRRSNLERWIVLVSAIIGVALGVFALVSLWNSPDGTLRRRLGISITLATECLMFCITWLIAWRGGRNSANLAIALALVAININGALYFSLEQLGHTDDALAFVVNTLTYFLGATLFLRATQQFPRAISPERLAVSPTIWGRRKPPRTLLTWLLKPVVLWPVVAVLTLADTLLPGSLVSQVTRLCIIGVGIVYFYVNYRGGDDEARRKVLWFLAWAVAAAVISLVILAVSAALGRDGSDLLRFVLNVTLSLLDNLAQLVCVAAAVFYAGAISPSLVIRKTVVFGLTTALLLFVFASVEVYLHHLIVHSLHVTDTLASSLIGGAFGLTFHPVKHYFEHLVQRVFGGKAAHQPPQTGASATSTPHSR
jgi:hypothetical protein